MEERDDNTAPDTPEDVQTPADEGETVDFEVSQEELDAFNEDDDPASDDEDSGEGEGDGQGHGEGKGAGAGEGEAGDGKPPKDAQDGKPNSPAVETPPAKGTDEPPKKGADTSEKEPQERDPKEGEPDNGKPGAEGEDGFDFDFEAAAARLAAEPLPDVLRSGDRDVPVKQFVADFPEMVPTIAHIACRLVKEALSAERKSQQPERDETRRVNQHVRQQIEREQVQAFMTEVSRQVGEDAGAFPKSEAFRAWLAKQPELFQRMAYSSEVADAVYVIQQYRMKNPARKAGSAVRSPAFDRKKGLLAGTVGGRGAPKAPVAASDDYDDAFNEG